MQFQTIWSARVSLCTMEVSSSLETSSQKQKNIDQGSESDEEFSLMSTSPDKGVVFTEGFVKEASSKLADYEREALRNKY